MVTRGFNSALLRARQAPRVTAGPFLLICRLSEVSRGSPFFFAMTSSGLLLGGGAL